VGGPRKESWAPRAVCARPTYDRGGSDGRAGTLPRDRRGWRAIEFQLPLKYEVRSSPRLGRGPRPTPERLIRAGSKTRYAKVFARTARPSLRRARAAQPGSSFNANRGPVRGVRGQGVRTESRETCPPGHVRPCDVCGGRRFKPPGTLEVSFKGRHRSATVLAMRSSRALAFFDGQSRKVHRGLDGRKPRPGGYQKKKKNHLGQQVRARPSPGGEKGPAASSSGRGRARARRRGRTPVHPRRGPTTRASHFQPTSSPASSPRPPPPWPTPAKHDRSSIRSTNLT